MFFLILGLAFLVAGIYFAMSGGIFGIVAYTFVPLGLAFMGLGLFMRGKGKNRSRLMQVGLDGTAIIKEMEQTSMQVNDQPVIKLVLEVNAPGRPQFTASMKTPISIVLLSQLRLLPGAELPVKVDPAKPESFIVDWNGALALQAATAAAGVS